MVIVETVTASTSTGYEDFHGEVTTSSRDSNLFHIISPISVVACLRYTMSAIGLTRLWKQYRYQSST